MILSHTTPDKFSSAPLPPKRIMVQMPPSTYHRHIIFCLIVFPMSFDVKKKMVLSKAHFRKPRFEDSIESV